jgi:hypothetical protein
MKFADSYGVDPSEISRESFFNIGGHNGFMRWGIYILLFIAFFYIAYTIIQRIRIWRKGKGELRTEYPEKRIIAVIKYVFFQAKSFVNPMLVLCMLLSSLDSWGFLSLPC